MAYALAQTVMGLILDFVVAWFEIKKDPLLVGLLLEL